MTRPTNGVGGVAGLEAPLFGKQPPGTTFGFLLAPPGFRQNGRSALTRTALCGGLN
jgi:hypothetical protein